MAVKHRTAVDRMPTGRAGIATGDSNPTPPAWEASTPTGTPEKESGSNPTRVATKCIRTNAQRFDVAGPGKQSFNGISRQHSGRYAEPIPPMSQVRMKTAPGIGSVFRFPLGGN
jgi:hypothetical protein